MAADVEAQKLSFPFDFFILRNIRKGRIDDGFRAVHVTEKAHLSRFPVFSHRLGIAHGFRQHRQKLGAVAAQGVQGAAADEAFAGPAVQAPAVHPFQKVADIPEGASLPSGLNDAIYCIFPYILDAVQSEEDFISLNGEIGFRKVHIGSGDFHPRPFCIGNITAHLLPVADIAGHHGRHEFRPEMGLQVRRLPGNPAIAHTVGFIEAVACKVDHEVKDIVGRLLIHPVLQGPFEEGIPVLLQDFRLLVAHGAAQHIGLAQAESPHDRGNLHDLFLVENDAVGFLQNRFQ